MNKENDCLISPKYHDMSLSFLAETSRTLIRIVGWLNGVNECWASDLNTIGLPVSFTLSW